MSFRWLAAAWLLSVPVLAKPVEPVVPPVRQAPLLPSLEAFQVEPPQRFDQSLVELERNKVITSAERRQLEGHAVGLTIDVPRMLQACRSGALSAKECASGVALRSRGRAQFRLLRRGPGGRLLPPLTVPVSALLAGSGSGFSLASVFAVTPRPKPLRGNGDRQLLFPIIGRAF
ncbi:MAG TPA: M23 family peptidase, partial [Prochlorococcus sp.]|nr:M23 family peptidase [Prochlorococcus sp.]